MQTIVIAAGGTGGHFFPAEALGEALVARGHRIVLMTDSRSSGSTSPVFAGREQYVISGAGIAGRGAVRGAKALFALARGVAEARRILSRINPATIVGFGGYPSVAPVIAAGLLRRRPGVVLHEQNAVLGRANRFLAGRASVLALSFADTDRLPAKVRTVVTGNPVRCAVCALADADYLPPETIVNLLVLGGSLGARIFSDVVPPAVAALPDALRQRLHVVQQCRPEDLARVRSAYHEVGVAAELAAFFPDVAARLAAAHLVVARAGASTVAELAVAGRPSLLVPLPGAIDDHQAANARALAHGGGWIMPQGSFTQAALTERLSALLSDTPALVAAAAAARRHATADAAERLAGLVEAQLRVEGAHS